MKVVVDTSAWYALIVSVDAYHTQAKEIITSEIDCIVLPTVFEEVISLIHSRQGKKLAIKVGTMLLQWGIETLSREEEARAWDLFTTTNTHISYVDCTIAVVAKENKLPVFAFDKHFETLGVELFTKEKN